MSLGVCTITSRSRLCQGIALYNSLERYTSDFKFFVLCTDKKAYKTLKKLNLPKVVPISADKIETDELLRIKSERTENDYCWTLKPVFLSYILGNFPEIDTVIHADADLYFFSDPYTILNEGQNHSVLVTMHLHAADDGVNSGFVCFKRDAHGLRCLEWWRKKCIDWCYFRYEGSKFGDQGYLDKMLKKFSGVHVIMTPGVNIALWNSYRFTFEKRGSQILVNNNPLIFYHFCGFRLLNAKEYGMVYSPEYIPAVYDPYIEELGKIVRLIEGISPGFFNYIGDCIPADRITRRGAL